MFKTTFAASMVLICCLGNPADASPIKHSYNGSNRGNTTTNVLMDDVINNNSRTKNVTNVDKSKTTKNVDRSNTTSNVNNGGNATALGGTVSIERDHASVPNIVGPSSPDSVPTLSIYYQVDSVGPVYGAQVSIPLVF